MNATTTVRFLLSNDARGLPSAEFCAGHRANRWLILPEDRGVSFPAHFPTVWTHVLLAGHSMPGYECRFRVQQKRKDLFCSICRMPMRDPVQISTCYHKFCDSCLQDYLRWVFLLTEFLHFAILLRFFENNFVTTRRAITRDLKTPVHQVINSTPSVSLN